MMVSPQHTCLKKELWRKSNRLLGGLIGRNECEINGCRVYADFVFDTNNTSHFGGIAGLNVVLQNSYIIGRQLYRTTTQNNLGKVLIGSGLSASNCAAYVIQYYNNNDDAKYYKTATTPSTQNQSIWVQDDAYNYGVCMFARYYIDQTKNSKYYTGNPSDFIDVPNNLTSLEVVESGDNGFARVIQCIEKVYDKTYVIVADCFYSAQWNQAELGSYDLLDVDYYYYDDANTTPTLFNDDNPTDHTLMVRAWFVGKKGETPKKLLFQHASLSGPEGPQEFDPALYTAEFSDDFKFSHIPENGDIYDDFETDGMDYMVKYFNDD